MCYKSLLRNGAVIIAATLITLAACKRNNNSTAAPALTNADDNGGYASDAVQLESHNNAVIAIADVAGTTGSAGMRTTSTCAHVTFDTTSSTHILTIDFGTTPCACSDGNTRSGKIIVTYSGRYKDSGSTHTITYNDYVVNGVQVTGHKSVTNNGTNDSGQVWYTIDVHDSLIYSADSIVSWTGSRTRTWLAGYSTNADWSDDVYAIGGTTTITRANGHAFTFTITTPLSVAMNCAYIESGIMDISSSTFTGGDRILNYGDGTCDNVATVTIGSHTYTITLH